MHRLDHSWTERETGYPWLAMRRVRLYQALVRVARETPEGMVPIRIHTGAAVVRIDCEGARLWLDSGEEVKGDVGIVANGVFVCCCAPHSRAEVLTT